MLAVHTAVAQQVSIDAKSYLVGHLNTDRVVIENNADTKIAPASLTKLMTLTLLFEALENGTLTLESQLPISEKAWRKAGSKMFLEVGKTVAVADLIKGIAISSGNDACIVVSEFLGGTEEAFAQMMQMKAEELGMENTTFRNSSGWPDPEQFTTARDMYKLAKYVIETYPQYYDVFALQDYRYNGIKQYNRNLLLKRGIGVDGLKTGHVEDAGYHLVASAKRGDDRLVSVVLGTETKQKRASESAKALSFVFTNNKNTLILQDGEVVETKAPVENGVELTVPLASSKELSAYMPRRHEKYLETSIVYQKPLVAPLQKGQLVGEIVVTNSSSGEQFKAPLVVGADVDQLDFLGGLKRKFGLE